MVQYSSSLHDHPYGRANCLFGYPYAGISELLPPQEKRQKKVYRIANQYRIVQLTRKISYLGNEINYQ